jgi:hypothetical protein
MKSTFGIIETSLSDRDADFRSLIRQSPVPAAKAYRSPPPVSGVYFTRNPGTMIQAGCFQSGALLSGMSAGAVLLFWFEGSDRVVGIVFSQRLDF